MAEIKPEQIVIEQTTKTSPDGGMETTVRKSIEPEDIIAIGGVAVAILVSMGIIFNALPVNEYTYGLAGLSAATALVVKTRKKPIVLAEDGQNKEG